MDSVVQSGYTLDAGGAGLNAVDEALLHTLLLDRRKAQGDRDFAEADRLREVLLQAGVTVNDKTRTFRIRPPQTGSGSAAIDTDFESSKGGPAQRAAVAEHGFRRVDDGLARVSDDDQKIIDQLLLEREHARQSAQLDGVRQLLAVLADAGVLVDDAQQTYRILPHSDDGRVQRRAAAARGYTRDTADASGAQLSAEDEAMVHQKLAARREAQRTKNFAEADVLRDELKAGGVFVNDKTRTYRVARRWEGGSDASAPSQGVRHDAEGTGIAEEPMEFDEDEELGFKGADASHAPSYGAGGSRQRAASSKAQMNDVYSRDGADTSGVQLSADDEGLLHQKLAARREAQRTRDFAEADRLKEELRAAGVTINDKMRTYRIAGVAAPSEGAMVVSSSSAADPAVRLQQLVAAGSAAMAAEHGWTRVDDGSVAVSPADQETVDRLLLERVFAKKQRAFDVADRLRSDLADLGVKVDDRQKTYSLMPRTAPGSSGEPSTAMVPLSTTSSAKDQLQQLLAAGGDAMAAEHGFVRADDGSLALSADDQQAVDRLLLERVFAKKQRQFDVADRLRSELADIGVKVDDKKRSYRVTGLPPAVPAGVDADIPPSLQSSQVPADRLQQLMAGGSAAMAAKHGYSRADDGSVVLSSDDQEAVDRLLLERVFEKRNRNFDAADRLRSELMGMGVRVDDLRNTYRVSAPSSGATTSHHVPPHPSCR